MTNKISVFATLLAASTAACTPTNDALDEGDDSLGDLSQEIYDPAAPPTSVATDTCDDSTYAGAVWSPTSSAHFTAYTIDGTAAQAGVAGVLAKRESAYEDIRAQLGLTAEPTISIYLSPNRVAAIANSRGLGTAFPGQDRYEVVYAGSADSFEEMRPGNLLTRTLEYHIDGAKHVPILSTGLAEVLDQSGRDLHDAYAEQLLATVETRVRQTSFEANDVTGKNIGRAGSLTALLIERYGMPTFLEILKASAVSSISGCSLRSATYGCINSATALTNMLDGILQAKTGDTWAEVESAWSTKVATHLDTVKLVLTTADRRAIKNLINLQDQAIAEGDAATYRSTMEGFYCEWGGEAIRNDIATRTVKAYTDTQSSVLAIYPVGPSNFRAARAVVRRLDARGMVSVQVQSLEKTQAGWRVTYGPDWY